MGAYLKGKNHEHTTNNNNTKNKVVHLTGIVLGTSIFNKILFILNSKTLRFVYISLGNNEEDLWEICRSDFKKLMKKKSTNPTTYIIDKLQQDDKIMKLCCSFVEKIGSSNLNSNNFAFDLIFGTNFQKKVWRQLENVSTGTTATYKDISKEINCPRAYRAVGTACGANKLALLIPCHRIVNSKENTSGLNYRWGSDIKVRLVFISHLNNNNNKKNNTKSRNKVLTLIMLDEYPVHKACIDGDLPLLKELLLDVQDKKKIKQILKSEDNDQRTPIHWAISYKHLYAVEALIRKFNQVDLDIDDLYDGSGWNPFHVACSVGDLNIVKLLFNTLDNKPNVNQQTKYNRVTGLHLVASKNNIELASYLITVLKASVSIKDAKGQIPLHRACCVPNSINMVKLLCDHQSPINLKDTVDGWTPLHHALAEGNVAVAILLVTEYDADYKTIRDKDDKLPVDVSCNDTVRQEFLANVE
ncbi:uncharacterized protein SCODWIG_00596 [Saccharomycodes ludwigii]|uniref:Methylated-DNA--protein-cysteine methyltransferase n=1 Tax=Saccharomycodes ludwigii TaxID=36035 RepID=A0A376B2B7_9ASCO|nr:uncharacterized protein SCODWIG_00596 [Saccharomycodes ludwigii]